MKHMKTNANSILGAALCTLLLAGSAWADDAKQRRDNNAPQTYGQGTPGTGASTESASTSSTLSSGDQKFIREAAKGGMMEVHMGTLGVQKAQNAQVKAYAQRLIDDHTKANAELKDLASRKGMALPDQKIAATGNDTDSDRTKVREHSGHADADMNKEHAGMAKLDKLSGADFDREFVRMAVKDHEKDVKEFEREAQKANDADVKAFAQKNAPVLREHLQAARALEPQVGNNR